MRLIGALDAPRGIVLVPNSGYYSCFISSSDLAKANFFRRLETQRELSSVVFVRAVLNRPCLICSFVCILLLVL